MIGRTNALLFTLFAGFASVCAGEPAGSLIDEMQPLEEVRRKLLRVDASRKGQT